MYLSGVLRTKHNLANACQPRVPFFDPPSTKETRPSFSPRSSHNNRLTIHRARNLNATIIMLIQPNICRGYVTLQDATVTSRDVRKNTSSLKVELRPVTSDLTLFQTTTLRFLGSSSGTNARLRLPNLVKPAFSTIKSFNRSETRCVCSTYTLLQNKHAIHLN